MAYFEIDRENNCINAYVPVNKKELRKAKKKAQDWEDELNNYLIRVIPVSMLSPEQNALIHILFQQIGDTIGDTRENVKIDLKNEFCGLREIPLFSFSRGSKDVISMELASDFINWIIEKALHLDVNLFFKEKGTGILRHARHFIKEIDQYVMACLRERKCAVCNSPHDPEHSKIIDLEHWDNVAQIGGYAVDDGLKTRFLPLCRKHHMEKHNIGRDEFEKKYILKGVWLNEKLVMDLKKVYPNHFKAFKEEK